MQQQFLDASLGFSAGVMLAASYWSLLGPAIEMSEDYGSLSFLPAAIGFIAGALVVYGGDEFLNALGYNSDETSAIVAAAKSPTSSPKANIRAMNNINNNNNNKSALEVESGLRRRGRKGEKNGISERDDSSDAFQARKKAKKWRAMMLLVIAITIHNFPEGLAVGVGFGAIGKSPGATFAKACNLAIGIGLQNFPEGLAVSLPLRRIGFSKWKAFWWGQMSGMVEPFGGLIGAFSISVVEPILPYSLALAAGAMIYVVVNDLVPDAHSSGNSRLATWGCMVGFVVMMTLDVALG